MACAVLCCTVLLFRRNTVWNNLRAEAWSTGQIQTGTTIIWLYSWQRECYVASYYRQWVSSNQAMVQGTISYWGEQRIALNWIIKRWSNDHRFMIHDFTVVTIDVSAMPLQTACDVVLYTERIFNAQSYTVTSQPVDIYTFQLFINVAVIVMSHPERVH